MLNFINKILNYFGYKILGVGEIEIFEYTIKNKDIQISELDSNNYKLFKEKDRLINILEEKDKDIQALEHKVHNLQTIIEEDKSTIELVDKMYELNSNVCDCSYKIKSYKQKIKERYKEINTLRTRVKGLIESRDNYKRKYKQVCGKLALKNCIK